MDDEQPLPLFNRHLDNLRSVCPEAADVFVCPICFTVFPRNEALDPLRVNLGHIWPKFIRNTIESDVAKHQHVLLCESCNSKAGYRGDHEMQEFEIARQGDEAGTPTRKRRIIIRPSNGDQELQLRAFYKSTGDKTASLTFRDHRNAFTYNEKYRRYREYAEQQVRCDVYVLPHDANWHLAQAGWLTSAYLYAFYTFGYRYIFHKSLDLVRNYILSSLDGSTNSSLDYRPDKVLSARTCSVHYSEQPNIMYMIPTLETAQIHFLEVSFLDYHVRLPGRDVHLVAKANEQTPDPDFQIGMASEGHIAHVERCHWDDLFDPVNYCVVGNKFSDQVSSAPNTE
ncbi:MAG: hypothetical protein K8L99_06665 [Anaerolineae bacterium]|nr:hypothetical protein [Anaerolineae bacterium]